MLLSARDVLPCKDVVLSGYSALSASRPVAPSSPTRSVPGCDAWTVQISAFAVGAWCVKRHLRGGLRASYRADLLDHAPAEVDGFQVVPVCFSPGPDVLPNRRSQLCSLIVSDEDHYDEHNEIMWQPPAGTSAQRAISRLNDAFGVVGVWPAAWVAAERVISICRARQKPPRLLEIGCGSGLPSICALAAGADVVATDVEELPLSLLKAAAEYQTLPGQLCTRKMDVLAAAGFNKTSWGGRTSYPSDEAFDVIVCSDCLYKHDVAQAIGNIIGKALLLRPTTLVVVTDADRRGSQEFLDELDKVLGLSLAKLTPPHFEPVPVPAWAADDARDPFDGTATEQVGLLSLL
mmetsp:Transcript_2445/g.4528  ORF Transcript_2445/g.4528 Transcript_2445/m.4528 type:complete len:348 (+) Transcript_2445:74-1117(+)